MPTLYYKPGQDDSIVDLEKMNDPMTGAKNYVGTEQMLKNSGYVPYDSLNLSANSPTQISQGSDGVRNEINSTINQATNLNAQITTADAQMTIDDLKKTLGFQDPNAPLSADERAKLDSAEIAERERFAPIIREAEEAKRQGMPKAVIGAGERGGFMSTQFAGAAALVPIEGGDFVGAGGKLEQVKSAYDRNIADLRSKQSQAMALARAKAEEAIRTGKSEANKQARELFELAQEANKRALEMQKTKLDIISKSRTEQEAGVKFAQAQEDRTIESVADALSSILGDDNDENLRLIAEAAKDYGITDLNRLIARVNDTAKENMFFKSGDFINLMKQIPIGQTMDITDPVTGKTYTLKGTSVEEPNVVTLTDDRGVVRGIDKKTGKELWKTTGGVGKSKTSINVNLPSQNRVGIYDKDNRQLGYQAFNPKTLTIKNFDLKGNEIDFPEGGRLGTLGAGFNEDEDELTFK